MAYRIDPKKITHYLLTIDPNAVPEARGKSKFFQDIGYDPRQWQRLLADLLQHPITSRLERETQDGMYRKRIYRCFMPTAPNGKIYCVRSVWVLRSPDYWLSSAYPQRPEGKQSN